MSLYSRFKHDPVTRTKLRKSAKRAGALALLAAYLAVTAREQPTLTARFAPVLLAAASAGYVAQARQRNPLSVHQGTYPQVTWRHCGARRPRLLRRRS